MNYTLPELNTTLTPEQVKVNVDSYCPWGQSLSYYNQDLRGNLTGIHLRGRVAAATLTVGFRFGESYTWIPDFKYPKFFAPDYTLHLDDVCLNPRPDIISPPRALPWNYTFDENVGITFPFQRGKFEMTMLTWARSDDSRHTWASMFPRDYRPFVGSRFFVLSADFYFEFSDRLFYDPTLDILFSTPAAPKSSGTTPTDGSSNLDSISSNQAAIAGGVSAAVFVLLVILAVVLVTKSRRARNFLLPFRQRRADEEVSDSSKSDSEGKKKPLRGEETLDEEPATPAGRPSAWSRAQKPQQISQAN